MVLPVEIVNGTIHFIQQSDPNTPNLVYATWALALGTIILAIATIVGIRNSRKDAQNLLVETRHTNRLLTLELKAKFKPKLDFENIQLFHDPNDVNHVNFSCVIKNGGSVPLSNILIYHIVETSKITLGTLVDKENVIKKSPHKVSGTIDPNRYHELPLKLEVDTKQDLWIAAWITYEYLETIQEEGIVIFYFQTPKGSGGFSSTRNNGLEWFSDNDIQRER